MSALLYKAWLETRVRFLAGLIAAALVCIEPIEQHAGLVKGWMLDMQSPLTYYRSAGHVWLLTHEYGWYLWHYLYNYSLQQLWVLFAVLFAFGGLIREKTDSTASFSLGLPISRRRWLLTRLSVALLESIGVSLFAVLVIIIGSSIIHETFSLPQVLLHSALMVAAGVFMIAFGNLCYTLFPGNYLSVLFTLILLGAPYLLLQLYTMRMRIAGRQTVFRFLDIPYAMSGPWQLNPATIPWISLLTIWTLTAVVLGVTVAWGDRVDY